MDPLAPVIARLHEDGRPRVWSLVITVFGDCVQHRGGKIATQRLGSLLGRIGIETGALRTALSRLSRDGWVEGQRQGRTSAYRLSTKGATTFSPATSKIYAAPRIGPVAIWTFEATPEARGLAIAGGTLRPADSGPRPGKGFAISGTLAPDARRAVADALPEAHRMALQAMANDLRDLKALAEPDPRTAAAARCLLIHRWRRLVLRWPEVPADLMPQTIVPTDLHKQTAHLYHRLTPQAEAWLDSREADFPAMPAADHTLSKRFGGAHWS